MKIFTAGCLLLCFLGLFAIAHSAESSTTSGDWTLKQVDRQISLQTQNARHSHRIMAINAGDKAASTFLLALREETARHLAFVHAIQDGTPVQVAPATGEGRADVTYYSVTLNKAVNPQEQTVIEVHYVFTHVQTPYPTHINQNDKQLVIYTDSHYFFSPYRTNAQKTTIKLASGSVESYSQNVKPATQKGDTLIFGSYDNVQAYEHSPLRIHFENNTPFLTITNLVREVEVSHWGNVAITEHINMQHDGAKLEGSFSRFDYQRSQKGAPSVIRSVVNLLPLTASDIYYRDEIGNISTSDIVVVKDKLAVDLTPRFPLFGGWKTQFTFGYNLPLSGYVFSDESSKVVLNVTFGKEFAVVDPAIDDITIRVILPEGSKDIDVKLPFAVDDQDRTLHHTYLDTAGRPVVVIHKKNVVLEHNQALQVSYNFTRTSMLLEPFILVISYFVVFLLAMFYVRFDLSISKDKYLDPKEAKQAQIRELVSRLKDIHDERTSLQQQVLKKVLGGKISAPQDKKKNDAAFNAYHSEVQQIEKELEGLHLGAATRVKQLERKEKEKHAVLAELSANTEANLEKKGNSNTYEAKKLQLQSTFNRLDEEVNDMVYDLSEEF